MKTIEIQIVDKETGVFENKIITIDSFQFNSITDILEEHQELYSKYGKDCYYDFYYKGFMSVLPDNFFLILLEIVRATYNRYECVPEFSDIIQMQEKQFSEFYEKLQDWFHY